MSRFVFDRSSAVPHDQQWKRHLQQQEYTGDVVRAIETSVKAYNERSQAIEAAVEGVSDAVTTAAIAQIESARRNASAIVGALELTSNRISDHIDSLGRALDDRLNALTYAQRVANLLLGDISQLLRIPDFQKERLYYTEQGLKHFSNAQKIDPSFYAEALDALLKAEEREKADYVVLYTIGMIYCYSPSLTNLPAAESYFLRAARYAGIESNPEAAPLDSILWRDVRNIPQSQVAGSKRAAAEAWLGAGFASYRQGKFSDAVVHAQRAVEIDPGYLFARFNACKYLAAAERAPDAVKELEPIIGANRSYSAITADDPDLASKREVRAMLERLRKASADRLASDLGQIEDRPAPFLQKDGDQHDRVARLVEAARDGRYLKVMGALDDAPSVIDMALIWERTLQALTELKNLLASSSPAAGSLADALSAVQGAKQYSYVQDLHRRMRVEDSDDISVPAIAAQIAAAESAIRDAETKYAEAKGTLSRLQQSRPSLAASFSSLLWQKSSIESAKQEIARLNYSSLVDARRHAEEAAASLQRIPADVAAAVRKANAEASLRVLAFALIAIGLLVLWLTPAYVYHTTFGGCGGRHLDAPPYWVPVLNWVFIFFVSIGNTLDFGRPCMEYHLGRFILTFVFVGIPSAICLGYGVYTYTKSR